VITIFLIYNSSTPLYNFGFHYITFDRRGPNTSHGVMGGNLHYAYFDHCRFIDNDTTAAGGALGISSFAPFATYPSDHVFVDDCEFVGSGNFGVQSGNADYVYVRRAIGFRNYREFIGVEPYGLGGENGRVRHFFAIDCKNYNPDDVHTNGSATGVYIITNSSLGVTGTPWGMDDINLVNCIDSGGNLASMHGFNILGGYNVTLVNCKSLFTGGWGFQVTSSAYGTSSFIKFIGCYARSNGRDGTRNAGLRVHDTQMSSFDFVSENNQFGIIEDGTSQLNTFTGNVINNVTGYTLNTGRPHSSRAIDLVTDSSGAYTIDAPAISVDPRTIGAGNVSTDYVITLGPVDSYGRQNFRYVSPSAIAGSGGASNIPSNRGTGYAIYSPQIPAFNRLNNGYGLFIDSTTTSGTLTFKVDTAGINAIVSKPLLAAILADSNRLGWQKVLNNSAYLTKRDTIAGFGPLWLTLTPSEFSDGLVVGTIGTTTIPQLLYTRNDSIWYNDGAGVNHNLERSNGGIFNYDSAFTGYKYHDTTISGSTVHNGIQFRRHNGTYTDITYFTFAAGSSSGGSGTAQGLQDVITTNPNLTGSANSINSAGSLIFNMASGTGFDVINGNALDLNSVGGRLAANSFEHVSQSISSNTTISLAYDDYYIDASSTNITITIPGSLAAFTRFSFLRVDASSHTVTITLSGGNIQSAGVTASTFTGLSAEGKNAEMKCAGTKCYVTSLN
jgi:hypothetical protein